jgi:hypothetical protein
MMAEKAALFEDQATRTLVLQAPNPGAAKALGRTVHGFDGVFVALRYLWAAPCTLVGGVAAALMLLCGARARWFRGVLEVSGGALTHRLAFDAITLGHVVLARTPRAMVRWRRHERVHVRQCERWGPAFFPAYLLAGAWQWLRGRSAYWDNPFEVAAFTAADSSPAEGSSRSSA